MVLICFFCKFALGVLSKIGTLQGVATPKKLDVVPPSPRLCGGVGAHQLHRNWWSESKLGFIKFRSPWCSSAFLPATWLDPWDGDEKGMRIGRLDYWFLVEKKCLVKCWCVVLNRWESGKLWKDGGFFCSKQIFTGSFALGNVNKPIWFLMFVRKDRLKLQCQMILWHVATGKQTTNQAAMRKLNLDLSKQRLPQCCNLLSFFVGCPEIFPRQNCFLR